MHRRRTSLVGVIVALAAAAGGTAAAAPAPPHASVPAPKTAARPATLVLPTKVWAVSLGAAFAASLTPAKLAALRENGVNTVVAERLRMSPLQIGKLERLAASARMPYLVAYVQRRPPAFCTAQKLVCVRETTSVAAAKQLAATSGRPVVLRLARISQLPSLGRLRRGRVIVLAPLLLTVADRAAWHGAATSTRSASGVDLGAFVTALAGLSAFEAVATGKDVAEVPPAAPTGPPGPVQNLQSTPDVASVTLTWDAPATGSAPVGYDVSVDGTPRTTVTTTKATLDLQQSCILGQKALVSVVAVDAQGQASSPVTLAVMPLCGGGGGGAPPPPPPPPPPTAYWLSRPANPSNASSAIFSFGGGTGATFRCSLDGGSLALCTSPQTFGALADGSHSFAVQPVDSTGAVGTTLTYTWSVDTVAPDTTITAQPTDPSNTASPSFAFTSADTTAGFSCALDGSVAAACTSPQAYTNLTDGSHTFTVAAVDAAGNVDQTPASYTWTVSTGQPDTTITGQPARASSSTAPTFTFTSSVAGATFRCSLDAAAFAACTSPKSYSGLVDGSHTFQVEAVDTVGNVDITPATYTWTVDTTAPDTTLGTTPANPTNAAAASFTFSASESGATFQCALDGAAFAACTSPKSYTALADGSHTFQVRASDAAGNADATPASSTWTVDTTAPNTSITSQPASVAASSSASFSFASTESGSTFQCALDGAAFASCSSPKSYSSLADGSHTFQVKAADALGNTDATPASYTWTVDTTAPNTSITSQPASVAASSSASFSFASTESGSTFQCALDGAAFASCSSPKSYSSLADGSHTFQVRATDGAGNVDATPASDTWTVDTVAPDTTITAQPTGTIGSSSASFSFSSTDTGATFECALDGAAFASCSSPKSYSSLADGSHTFQVRARDAAGNTDTTPASSTWTVDTTAPNTSITAQPVNPTTSTSASFSFSSTESGSTFQCALDGAPFASCSSPKSYSSLADGSHLFQVRAADALGNTDTTPASYTWTVDTAAPNTTITAQPANPTTSTSASFSFSSTESGSSFQCSLDGAAFASCSSPAAYTGLATGSHTFQVKATDAAGNTDGTPASYTWTISTPDTTPPTTPTGLISTGSTTTTISVTWSASSDNVAVTAYGAYQGVSRVGNPTTTSYTFTGLTCGTSYTLGVDAVDAAGNRSSITTLGASTSACSGGSTASAFVATTGSDANACTQAAPCLTFNRAYRVAQPGQTVEVAAGSYAAQTMSVDASKSGSTSPVVFRPAAGAAVTVAGGDINTGYVEWRDMTVSQGLAIEPASSSSAPSTVTNVTLRNLTMESVFVYANSNLITGGSVGGFNACDPNNQEDGVDFWMRNNTGTTGNVVDGVVLHDISIEQYEPGSNVCGSLNRHSDCIQILSGHDLTIENSTFYNCPTSDVIARPYMDSLTNITIENNFLGGVAHPGSNLSLGTSSPPDPCGTINVLYNTSIGSGIGGGCSSNVVNVKGNILQTGSCSAGYVFSYNVFLPGSAVCGSNAFQCSPVFATPNSPTSDFHLALTDTCALNRGDASSFPSTDHDGGMRPLGPAADIGADEAG